MPTTSLKMTHSPCTLGVLTCKEVSGTDTCCVKKAETAEHLLCKGTFPGKYNLCWSRIRLSLLPQLFSEQITIVEVYTWSYQKLQPGIIVTFQGSMTSEIAITKISQKRTNCFSKSSSIISWQAAEVVFRLLLSSLKLLAQIS